MLTRTGEYALQAMVYLAQHETEWPISGPKIAQETQIPQKYLSAILAVLVRGGVLRSARGKNGGFHMVRSPKATVLIEILGPFEPVLGDRRPCPFGNPVCNDDDPCAGHARWKRVRDAYNRFVQHTSVYDVAVRRSAVRRPRRKARTRKSRSAPR